jgi:hypothetical protein
LIWLARLALRLSRFELIAATMMVAVLATLAILIRAELDGTAVTDACWDEWQFLFSGVSAACEGPLNAYFEVEQRASTLMQWMTVVPFAAGVVLGVPLVGRELELGTAAMAWSVAPSRHRWLLARLAPFLVYTLVVIGLLALAADILWLGRELYLPRVRFGDASLHGPPVVARSLATLGIGALTGAVIGRTLPAAILAVGLAFALLLIGQFSFVTWLDAEAARNVIVLEESFTQDPDDLFLGGAAIQRGWADPAGAFLDDTAAAALAPANSADPMAWVGEHLRRAVRGVPAERYPAWVTLETLGLLAVAVGAIASLFPVVARRRPH